MRERGGGGLLKRTHTPTWGWCGDGWSSGWMVYRKEGEYIFLAASQPRTCHGVLNTLSLFTLTSCSLYVRHCEWESERVSVSLSQQPSNIFLTSAHPAVMQGRLSRWCIDWWWWSRGHRSLQAAYLVTYLFSYLMCTVWCLTWVRSNFALDTWKKFPLFEFHTVLVVVTLLL